MKLLFYFAIALSYSSYGADSLFRCSTTVFKTKHIEKLSGMKQFSNILRGVHTDLRKQILARFFEEYENLENMLPVEKRDHFELFSEKMQMGSLFEKGEVTEMAFDPESYTLYINYKFYRRIEPYGLSINGLFTLIHELDHFQYFVARPLTYFEKRAAKFKIGRFILNNTSWSGQEHVIEERAFRTQYRFVKKFIDSEKNLRMLIEIILEDASLPIEEVDNIYAIINNSYVNEKGAIQGVSDYNRVTMSLKQLQAAFLNHFSYIFLISKLTENEFVELKLRSYPNKFF